jgi:hypothetical protein
MKERREFAFMDATCHYRSADFQSAVSRVFNPLDRTNAWRRRLQIGDTAECNSALRNLDSRHLVIVHCCARQHGHKRHNFTLDNDIRQAFNALCETGPTERERGHAEYRYVL